MKTIVIVSGILSAIFSVFHIAFWWLFDWPSSLGYMTADHRMLMQTFNFCMTPLFVFSTYAYLSLRNEMLSTKLGRLVMLMNSTIFLLRAAAEPIFGNLRTGQSQFFFVLSLAVSAFFAIPLLKRPIAGFLDSGA